MPHLQFDINRTLGDEDKIAFAEDVRLLFARVMDTGVDHISISIREFATHNLSIGRAKSPEKGIAVINADVRQGRSIDQRRSLSLGFMDLMHKRWGIPKEQIYVTLTEHKGEDFHLCDRYLGNWKQGEDPLAD